MNPNRTRRTWSGLALAMVAFGLVGCGGEGPPRPPKVKVTVGKKETAPPPKEQAKPEKPAPPEAPEPEAPAPTREKLVAAKVPAATQPAIRLSAIRSKNPHPTKEQAIADALIVARTELMKQLDLLDPPIHTRPSMVTMKQNYLKGEPREILPTEEEKSAIRANNLNPNVRWVEIDLELTDDQIQKLRSAERVTDGFRVAGLLFALIAAGYGFLRLDQWTKGYLTLWLGLGAGAAVIVVGLLILQ